MTVGLEVLHATDPVVLVEIVDADGSTPRDKGAYMLVSADRSTGTIGGGQLEYRAIAQARQMLVSGQAEAGADIPLGPEIDQCCGGRVRLKLSRVTDQIARTLDRSIEREEAEQPQALVFGGGHVGAALMGALAPLPITAKLIETRDGMGVTPTALPEQAVRNAPSNAAFIVTTHDHSLDFLITGEALARGDAAYVGLIGSATKRARLERWMKAQMPTVSSERLVCPIGAQGLGDKRPAVIAAFVAAELLSVFRKRAP